MFSPSSNSASKTENYYAYIDYSIINENVDKNIIIGKEYFY